ncbi:MAG: hypothetical protein JJ916_00345 [Phycisphaerales bacterium]|nr:hypothetical protein [Phycisphaerales bacterium]
MHTDTLTTDSLLDDILDPSMSAPAICRAHNITLSQLIEYIQGPDFHQLTVATRLLSESRTRLLALDIAPRAMQALDQSTETTEESRLLNETIRKSASRLLTIARQSTRDTNRLPPDRGAGTDGTQMHIPSPARPASDQDAAGKLAAQVGGGGVHRSRPGEALQPWRIDEDRHVAQSAPAGGNVADHPRRSTPAQAIIAAAGSARPAQPSARPMPTQRTPP